MKAVIAGVITAIVVSGGLIYFMKTNPNMNKFDDVSSSWLAAEEKTEAIHRIAGMKCDTEFRKAFIPGTLTTQTGMLDEMEEQEDSFQVMRNMGIVNGTVLATGTYICKYYKDGRQPYLQVSLKPEARPLLKK
ncbi:hypothetical protein KP12_125 [Klebsiella phage KP12]|uniref:Uncharacterized protein n=1 Tax=Klebsiella phage KP12 TaxID=2923374 RepID=A0A9E6Z6N1_9CAUD|nr:hypothetical protein KP12_125 [Klebsiella phage KP12]